MPRISEAGELIVAIVPDNSNIGATVDTVARRARSVVDQSRTAIKRVKINILIIREKVSGEALRLVCGPK